MVEDDRLARKFDTICSEKGIKKKKFFIDAIKEFVRKNVVT